MKKLLKALSQHELEQPEMKLLQRLKTFFQANLDQHDPIAAIACGGLF